VRRVGAETAGHIMIAGLLTCGDRVAGAFGFDITLISKVAISTSSGLRALSWHWAVARSGLPPVPMVTLLTAG